MSGITYKGPVNPNPGDGEARIIIYGYVPSYGLAITGVITFALVLAANIIYAVRKKGYRSFHILLAVGALMECGGYAARIYSHTRPFVVGSFVAQYFLIVVAPVLFSAAIYLSLNLTVRAFAGVDQLLILRPRLVLAFFITADVVTTIIQVVGAALIGVSESAQVSGEPSAVTPQQANDILIAGLAIQTFSFLTFLVILITVFVRASTSGSHAEASHPLAHLTASEQTDLRRVLTVITVTSDLILLRTVFRLAESAQGFFGFASTHEVLFALLEYLPVILALGLWSIFTPSKFLGLFGTPPAPERKRRGRDGSRPDMREAA